MAVRRACLHLYLHRIWEITNAFANTGVRIARTPLYLGAVACSAATYEWGVVAQLVTFGTLVVFVLMWRIRRGVDGYVKDITASILQRHICRSCSAS